MFNWLNFVDRGFSPYPHQLANAERILKHNALYIFDEVGTGKTFSAAAMTLEYLENKYYEYMEKNKTDKGFSFRTLVISPVKEQFANDWIKYFGFVDISDSEELKLTTYYLNPGQFISTDYNVEIKFVTPHKISYGNIKFDGDLLIIDEAHMFLSDNAKRTKVLKNGYYEKEYFKSSKVVFMTATPCKRNIEDLKQYTCLADSILKTSLSDSGSKLQCNIDTVSSLSTDLNCTRLFKNIVDGLISDNWYGYNSLPHRKIHMWDYNGTTRNEALVNHLQKLIHKDHRFIIFVKYVKVEAEELGIYLKIHLNIDESDICVVTGKNKNELFKYSGEFPEKNPKILILTYQIADKGINLQSFDYVINYHISALPSSLEQRFGRIDRPRSKPQDVNMCYLVNCDNSSDIYAIDRYSKNFYIAAVSSMNIIQDLPCRNAIFTLEMLSDAHHQIKILHSYVEQLIKVLKDSSIEAKLKRQIECIIKEDDIALEYDEQIDPYLDFIDTDKITIDEIDDVEQSINLIIENLKSNLESLQFQFPSESSLVQAKKFIDNIKQLEMDDTFFLPDTILYFDSSNTQYGSHAIFASECINKIRKTESYHTFKELYDKHRKSEYITNVVKYNRNIFIELHSYLLYIFQDTDNVKALEKKFEDAFSNESDFIFSPYREILWIYEVLNNYCNNNFIKDYYEYIINILYQNIPLLNLIYIFKNNLLLNSNKERFLPDKNPFKDSYCQLIEAYNLKKDKYPLNLISTDFILPSYTPSIFSFNYTENKIVATPWYKLAFILMSDNWIYYNRRNITNSIPVFSYVLFDSNGNQRSYVYYHNTESYLKNLPNNFSIDMLQNSDVCTKAMIYTINPDLINNKELIQNLPKYHHHSFLSIFNEDDKILLKKICVGWKVLHNSPYRFYLECLDEFGNDICLVFEYGYLVDMYINESGLSKEKLLYLKSRNNLYDDEDIENRNNGKAPEISYILNFNKTVNDEKLYKSTNYLYLSYNFNENKSNKTYTMLLGNNNSVIDFLTKTND